MAVRSGSWRLQAVGHLGTDRLAPAILDRDLGFHARGTKRHELVAISKSLRISSRVAAASLCPERLRRWASMLFFQQLTGYTPVGRKLGNGESSGEWEHPKLAG